MSSRALRRLQRERDTELGSVSLRAEVKDDSCTTPDEETSDTADSVQDRDAINHKKSSAPTNLFDLLNEDDAGNSADDANTDDCTEQPASEVSASPVKTKKKRKKKAKDKSSSDAKAVDEDIDACIHEVNTVLGTSVLSSVASAADSGDSAASKPILSIEHRCLNPDNEVRRLFGSRVVQADQRRQRTRNRHRNMRLSRPRDNWPVFSRTGLSMRLIETTPRGIQYFVFEHSKSYQKIQFEFLDAVESLNPQNIVNLHNEYPYHIDTLLQLGEILKMGDDRQAAAEMIERALHVFESSFHPLFSLTQGTSQLPYKYAENRSFYLALWRHAVSIGRKGCYRTALEYCKLILSLDPDEDPLCMLLLLDFYALRSEQYDFLVRMYSEWESHRNLSQLPNFAFSLPLAMFHQSVHDGTDQQKADDMLETSLLMFPGLLLPLLDKCGIAADRTVQDHYYFGTQAQMSTSDALKQLQMLYIGRCESCWKEPPVITWLEKNVHKVIDRISDGIRDQLLNQYAQHRQTRYRGTPRNVCRHIIVSEIKEATAALPPEISLTPVLSYDPLPPLDSVASYTRPPRPTRAQESGSSLAMFFRSLAPNFNPQERAAGEENGAAGGQDLRQGVTALMDVMRDLLNSIRFIPPPIENPQADVDGPADDDDDVDDDANWQ